MKPTTVWITTLALAGIVYQSHFVNCQHGLSPILDEVEFKKSLFYNRKPEEKVKVVYVRVPSDEPETRMERKSGMYWNRFGYGQPPLNPTGPPPGAFSPGSPYYKSIPISQKRRSPGHRPPKRKYRLKPTRAPYQLSSMKTPCPYRMLAEELVEHQQRHSYMPPPPPPPPPSSYYPPPPPPPTPPPTTPTTTTTPAPTTPAPAIFLGGNLMSIPQLGQQPIFIQTIDPIQSSQPQHQSQHHDILQRLQQQTGLQFEQVSPDLFQTSSSASLNPQQSDSSSMQFQVFVDANNNAYIIQPAQPQQSQQQQHQPQQISPSLPQFQQILLKTDGNSAQPQILIAQQPQQQHEPQGQPQPIGRIGNQLIYDRLPSPQPQQQSSPFQQIQTQQQQSQPQQHQQPQIILLENPQNSQNAPQALILPNGQVLQPQQTQQHSQQNQPSLVIINPQSQNPEPVQQALQFIQQSGSSPSSISRPAPQINFGATPTLPDFTSLFAENQSNLHKNHRASSPGSIPIIFSGTAQQRQDDEEEEDREPIIVQSRKKSRRNNNHGNNNGHRQKDKKRYVIISKKELEQMKQKKQQRENGENQVSGKNLPPPPEVVHIPFHQAQEEDSDEDDEQEEEENHQGSSFSNHKKAVKSFKKSNAENSVPIIKASHQSSFSNPEERTRNSDDDNGNDDNSSDD